MYWGYPDRPGLIVTRNLLKSSGLSKCILHVSEKGAPEESEGTSTV